MKVAVFSDIHGNRFALETILNDISKRSIDKMICLGDVVGLGPSSDRCLSLIMEHNVDMVLGNHELYYLYGTGIDYDMEEGEILHQKWIANQLNQDKKYREFLEKKDITLEFDQILCQHFFIKKNQKGIYPFYDLNILKDETFFQDLLNLPYQRILIGHEHFPFYRESVVDVGTSGCKKDSYTSYVILDTNDYSYEKVVLEYDRDAFVTELKSVRYPDQEVISKIFFGVDL